MKKLLILVLVLGMSSLANAGLIFTVNGLPATPDITLKPSETAEIDLEISAGSTILGYTIDWQLRNLDAGPADAEFVYGGVNYPLVFEFASTAVISQPQLFEATGSQFLGAALPGPATIMQGLMIHCLRANLDPQGAVILEVIAQAGTVIDGVELPAGTVLSSLMIHQIPEPMTLTLLGLGGLFLARRKK
jgi:hypothetical protein